ncbi:MAG TPA: GNAT family N-acetyltransferase [Gaiellaceae bacterium]|nr:GNAT family N-acetyltransferase [Gaiellaceae bacterium]
MTDAVTLREITADTVRQVTALDVTPEQRGLVASNAVSIAQAYFEPKAWFRAVAAGDELVGFVMVYRERAASTFHVWRFMVDARHQGRGYGRRAMELLIEEARSDGATEVTLSVVPGDGSALDFYAGLGFEETGEIDDGEVAMRLPLDRDESGRASGRR